MKSGYSPSCKTLLVAWAKFNVKDCQQICAVSNNPLFSHILRANKQMVIKFTKQSGSSSDLWQYPGHLNATSPDKPNKENIWGKTLITSCYGKHKAQIHWFYSVNKSKSALTASLFLSPFFLFKKNKRSKFIISEFMSVRMTNSLPWQITTARQRHLDFPGQQGWEFLISSIWFPRNRRGCSCSLLLPPIPSLPSVMTVLMWRLNTNFQTTSGSNNSEHAWKSKIKLFAITNSPFVSDWMWFSLKGCKSAGQMHIYPEKWSCKIWMQTEIFWETGYFSTSCLMSLKSKRVCVRYLQRCHAAKCVSRLAE